ncbi:U-box domain-containing protein 19 [Arabidopsis thaliana]|uniref:RING-type E3 ubiquitin transferase n=2 Tax=Arabidopsis TaxID=3701 RepID=A0A178WID1_ARATH|nr:U box domain [Arabidopsis thaliana x Arabidopsis arenosa]OAP18016.1 PUB19 [Arabidopsis thaliana]
MIHTQTGSSRRILTFPAVNPCESISLTTLVDSLLQIAGEILSFKPKHFSTNKRSVKETLRHVQTLVIFFEELRIQIRVGSIPAGRSVILSLSELHVIFQKLKFLLDDCTRDGAKLYMLMNSGQVSAHFRALTRSISTSLDTFPVRSVDLPGEVNELIYLVMRQTRKTEARPDRDDKRAIDSVYWFFNLFENRINPNSDEILRVLDHIGVRKWRDCVKEIDFLREEISVEKKSNIEIELLSNLMGFICYCRCVILRGIDVDDEEKDKEEDDLMMIRSLNVDDLRCPISLEIMSDPVVLETGHTYDRSSITKWFASGNITCPKTGKTLVSTVLVDNFSVKQVIQSYSKQNGVVLGQKGKKKVDVAESLAAEEAGKLTAEFLAGELIKGDEEEMVKAFVEIRILTKTSSFYRSCLVEAGVVESLMKILRSDDPRIQENAMAGIMNLSKDIAGKTRIVGEDGGGLRLIVEVLNDGARRESRQYAAAALFYLSSLGDYSRLIGEISDAIPGLVRIVKSCDYGDSAKRNALIAIRSLLMNQPDNHWRILAAGIVPVLLDLVKSEEISDGVTADSMAILAKMAEYPDGMISVLRRGGLKLAVKILGSSEVSPATKQHCVALLLNLCHNGGSDVVGSLAKNPSIMGSLYTASSNGELGGGKKASALIKMIHEFQERKTGPGEPVLERERFVHAW